MQASHSDSTSGGSDAGPTAFGLIVIGDEVLNGGRQDAHLPNLKALLAERGHQLAWYWMLPDDPTVLIRFFHISFAASEPVLCCGGIGATPDDHTRACVAAAADLPLARHPAAQAQIEQAFGASAYPYRILMADLPAGCTLIPNPHSPIPGFGLRAHWFLPGFPQMALPMARWVLDQHYGHGSPLRECSVQVVGVPESRLIPLMRQLGERWPALKVFSLPHIGEDPHIVLGIRGRSDLGPALTELKAGLDAAGFAWRE
jgi:molybdopterin-biosynthesis enzyme MoeA-like protein